MATNQTNTKANLKIIIISAVGLLMIFNANLCKRDSKKPTADHSIAVLPFRVLNEDSTTYPFIEGFRETLLNELVNSGRYRVISRVSPYHNRDPETTMRKIGRELHADYIIQGSIAIGDTVMKLWVQAIQTIDDQNIWTKTFSEKLLHVFDLQQSISKEIARAVDLLITDDRRQPSDNSSRQRADSVRTADKNYGD